MGLDRNVHVMAQTVYGEARGEPVMGQIAVGFVIKHRASIGGWWGHTIEEVCMAPLQFSAWNKDDPNRRRMLSATLEEHEYAIATWVALGVLLDEVPDHGRDATHYHSVDVNPKWALNMVETARIGRHVFMKAKAN